MSDARGEDQQRGHNDDDQGQGEPPTVGRPPVPAVAGGSAPPSAGAGHVWWSPVRLLAVGAGLPAALMVGAVVGVALWWFEALYFDAARAACAALTLALLLWGSLTVLVVGPPGRWRARVWAAAPAVWAVAVGIWVGVAA
jgi:hypothetical protein